MDSSRFIASARQLALVLVGLGALSMQLGTEEYLRQSRMRAYAYIEKVSEIKALLENEGWEEGVIPSENTLRAAVSWDGLFDLLRQRNKEISDQWLELAPQSRSNDSTIRSRNSPTPVLVPQTRQFPNFVFRSDASQACGFAVSRGSSDAEIAIPAVALPLGADEIKVRGSDIYFVQLFISCSGDEAHNPPFLLIDTRQALEGWMIFNTSTKNPQLRFDQLLSARLPYPHGYPEWRRLARRLDVASYATGWTEFQREQVRALSHEAFLPIRFSILEADLVDSARAEGIRISYPLNAADIARDLMDVRRPEPTIFGLTTAAVVAVRLLPFAVLLIAFAIWHRTRRILTCHPENAEPWLLIRPHGLLEKGAAALWAAAIMATPLIAAGAAAVFTNLQWPNAQMTELFFGAVVRERSLTAGFEALRHYGVVIHWWFICGLAATAVSTALLGDSLRRIYRLNTSFL